jgi:hypothetical protein
VAGSEYELESSQKLFRFQAFTSHNLLF